MNETDWMFINVGVFFSKLGQSREVRLAVRISAVAIIYNGVDT